MIDTLERIIALGGDQTDVRLQIAPLYIKRGHELLASQHWVHAIRALLDSGQSELAQQVMASAVTMLPHQNAIAELAVDLALAAGDQAQIETALRRSVRLSLVHENYPQAQLNLIRLGDIAPHDTWSRFMMVEVAIIQQDPQLDPVLRQAVKYALLSKNYGLADYAARARVELAEAPAYSQREDLIEVLHRSDFSEAELSEGRKLFEDYAADAAIDEAIVLLERLVANHQQEADLVTELAQLYVSVDRYREAVRFYKHAVVLWQQEDRLDQATQAIVELLNVMPGDEQVLIAQQLIQDSRPVDWSEIRDRQIAEQQRRLENEFSTATSLDRTTDRRVKQEDDRRQTVSDNDDVSVMMASNEDGE